IHISGPNGSLGQHGWTDQMVLSFVDADGDGSATSQLSGRYLYGPAVDEIFAVENGTGDVLWALTDQLGTPRDWAQRTSSGNTVIAQHIRYTAFGAIDSITDGAGNPLATSSSPLATFTGQLNDPDAGLIYYRARWYDPQLGKFISDDPMGFDAGDTNVSRYVGNHSADHFDPTGQDELRYGNVVFVGSTGSLAIIEDLWEQLEARAQDLNRQNDPRLYDKLYKYIHGDREHPGVVITLTLVDNTDAVFGGTYRTGELDVDDLKYFPTTDGPNTQQAEILLHEIAEQAVKKEKNFSKYKESEYERAHAHALIVEGLFDGWVRQDRIDWKKLPVGGGVPPGKLQTWYYKNSDNLELSATTGISWDGSVLYHKQIEDPFYKDWLKTQAAERNILKP
ncbi:MAG: RHS repeat-associated core domain-containing protein, partial [Planctomycetaceae bacterium]|nr:RHS repeat-associated core domain-containing protein [Planctomycetaceae bacterium]